jgi:DNA replication protein DnaC
MSYDLTASEPDAALAKARAHLRISWCAKPTFRDETARSVTGKVVTIAKSGDGPCVLLAEHPGACLSDRAWMKVETEGVDEAAQEAANDADSAEFHLRLWIQAGAPKQFWDVQLDGIDLPEDMAATVRRFAWGEDEDVKALILGGEVGCGKTWTAATVLRLYVDESCDPAEVAWVNVVDLVKQARLPSLEDIAELVDSARVVLLDDLGACELTDRGREILFALVDRVWRNGGRFVVTTNCTPPALRELVGARTFDRLRDGATWLVLPGGSRRGDTVIPLRATS